MALATQAVLSEEVPVVEAQIDALVDGSGEGLFQWYRQAIGEVFRILDDAPESRWTRRIREVLRRPRRLGGRGNFASLSAEEEARRARVYLFALTDRESGRRLGVTGQAYQRWRRRRGLPAWRRACERAGPPRPGR